MPFGAPTLPDIQSPQSLRLGCFTLSIKDTHENTHDPFIDRPTADEIDVNVHGSFYETQTLSKSSKFCAFVTDILSISNEKWGKGAANLVAPQLTTHKLRNNTAWFEEASSKPETRAWLLKALNNRCDVYLLVGFFILTDARLATVRTSSTLGSAGGEASALPTGVAALGDVMTLTGGVRSTRDVSYGRISVLDTPGDQIFGMWYRKVRFNWYFSREAGIPSIEHKTRWRPLWEARGKAEEEEDDEDSDYEEEPDIVEAGLERDVDWEEQGDIGVQEEGDGRKGHCSE